ncbi:MAG TPA: glycosyltransferase family 2 protein, partial [Gemmataceae bacterium]
IDVSVCIANWNCHDYLRRCLESLLDQPQGVRLEVIVADNGSCDGAAEMAARDFPEVVLVRNADNLGFARASNQAAELARGRYVFFLNNDTVVPALTLRRLFDYAEAHPEVGMIGPRLRDGEGRLQISYRDRPTVAAMLHRTALLRWTGLFRRAYRRYRREQFRATEDRRVEILMGAAVLMRRDVFEACGRWDERFRFGGEDIDLSNRVGRERPLVYLAGVEITHYGRVSSRQNVEFAAPNVAIGYVRYFRKAGASRAALAAYKLAVTIDVPLQLLAKAGQWAWRRLRGKREKAAKSLRACKGLWRFLRHELGRFWKA